jgi:hypothetical protein
MNAATTTLPMFGPLVTDAERADFRRWLQARAADNDPSIAGEAMLALGELEKEERRRQSRISGRC